MPQPYRNTSDVKIRWNPLSKRPRIAQLIAEALAAYAMADAMLANILGKVLEVDEQIGLEVYLALKAEGPAKLIFDLLVKPRISTEAYASLSALRDEIKSVSGWRNDFAHGVYAIADDEPDNILIVKPADSARYFAVRFNSMGRTPPPMQALVYTEKEIDEYRTRVSELAENVFRFGRGL